MKILQNNFIILIICYIITYTLNWILFTKYEFKKSLLIKASKSNQDNVNKIHITYFHYLDTADPFTKENFRFFMRFAYKPCDPDVDFTFIFNVNEIPKNITDYLNNHVKQDILEEFKQCLDDNNYQKANAKNTRIVLRLNSKESDLCSYVELFNKDFTKVVKSLYKYFFFINSTIRGPFLPNYWLRPW